MSTFLVSLGLVGIVVWIVAYLQKQRRKSLQSGGCGSACGCSGCSGCSYTQQHKS